MKVKAIPASVLTALLLILCFPAPDFGWLAWIALVPLALACRELPPLKALAAGFLCGVIAAYGIFFWIFEVPGFQWYHSLPLAVVIATPPALWGLGLSLSRSFSFPLLIFAPALWVCLDWLKAHSGFLSLPWATLAQSQHGNIPLLRIASWTGEYGVTFLVVMVNAALAETIGRRRWKPLAAAVAVTAALHLPGIVSLSSPPAGRKVRAAAVQPAITPAERVTPEGRERSLERLEALTMKASGGADLVAWPETAIRDLPKHPELIARVESLARAAGTPLVIGASEFAKILGGQREERGDLVTEERSWNTAWLVLPDGIRQPPYRKRRLLPFGEYTPLEGKFPWPSWMVPDRIRSLAGEESVVFTLPDGLRAGPIICWENLFPDFVRRLAGGGVDLIVHLTNDNWFGRSAASRQHNLASVLRAVENGTPILLSSNTGPSLVIDARGRKLAAVPGIFTTGVAVTAVTTAGESTFYTRQGDLFAFTCMFVAAGGLLAALRRRVFTVHRSIQQKEGTMKQPSRITGVQLFILAAALLPAAVPAGANGLDKQGTAAPLNCPGNAISFTGHNVTAAKRTYNFEGTCWYDSTEEAATNEMLKYKVAASFETPNKVKEIVTLVLGTAGLPGGTTYVLTCNSNVDPWLDKNAPCTNKNLEGPQSMFQADLISRQFPVTRGALTEGDRLGITYALLGALNISIESPTQNYVFSQPDRVTLIGRIKMPGDMDLPPDTVMVFKVWTRGWPQPGVETKEFLKFQKVTPMGYANHPVKDIPPGDWWVQARILGKESKFWSSPVAFGIKGVDQEAKSIVMPKMILYTAPVINIAKPGQGYAAGQKIPFNVKHAVGETLIFDVERKAGEKWTTARLPRPQLSTPMGGAPTVESRALFLVSAPGKYRIRAMTESAGARWSKWQMFEVTAPGQIQKTKAPAEVDATGGKKTLEPVKKIEIKPAPSTKLKSTKPKVVPKAVPEPKPAAPAVGIQ